MNIFICNTYEDMSRKAADIMAAQLTAKPTSVLGLATGSTPVGLYRELVRRYEAGELSFARAKTVNLDEYCGLDASHDQSYAYFMNHHLFSHVDLPEGATHIPDGTNPDGAAECARYDALIRELGGVDLQLLGIGGNGHIGFNEPSDTIALGTIHVALTESTVAANSRFFASADLVPRYAYSMGCGAILSAREILLVANGRGKAEILEQAFFGDVTPKVPASLLRLVGDRVTVVCDAEAGALMRERHPSEVTVL